MKPTYEELEAENAALRQEVSDLKALVKELLERIAVLEAQVNKNSKNSSKPPSSDQKPNLPPAQKKEHRPYHPGASRQLLPESVVTSREVRRIENCPRCRSHMEPTGEVIRWQQVELPEIKPLVHQIELCACRCPKCKLTALPELRAEERYLLGPRLESFINLCMGQFRQGHRAVREFVAVLIPDLDLSQGLISKVKFRAALAFDTARQQIKNVILNADNPTFVDASGWRHQGKNEHVIVIRVGKWVNFTLVAHQNGKTLAELVEGRKLKHLVTDRGLAVSKISSQIHQYCLAHLLRNIRGLAEHPAVALTHTEKLGEVYDTLQELFRDKHRMDRDEISISTWRQYGYLKWRYMKETIEEILSTQPIEKLRRACKRMLKDWDHFTVYLRNREYPMTNNPAEEALRNIVIARKLCFGSRSGYGRSWRAAIQTCIETLRRQGRSVLDFLTDAICSARMGIPSPNIT